MFNLFKNSYVSDGYFPENIEAFYTNAFGDFYQDIWANTKFMNEYRDLSLKHSLNSFLHTNSITERDRRKVLYYYCAPYMSVDDDSILNRLRSVLETDNLYIIKALRAICTLYLYAPSRDIIGSNAELLTDIINDSEIDAVMLKAHKYAKLSGEVAIRPLFVDGRLNFEIVTSENYRCVYDNKKNLTEIWIYKPRIINDVIYDCFDVWNNEEYKIIEKNGNPFKLQGEDKMENPYKFIPYSILNLSGNNIYSESNDLALWELFKAQLSHNRMKILEENTAIFNGFPITTIVNYEIKRNNFRISPGKVLTLENVQQPADGMNAQPYIDIISPTAQYNDLSDLRTANIKNTMRNMNLPNSMIEDGANLQSGVALEIDRIGLEEYRSEDRGVLKRFETVIINLIAKIASVDINFRYNGQPYIVGIDFNEVEMPADAAADYELQKSKFKDGLISPLQFLMKTTDIDKVVDNAEAIAIITENKNYYKLIYGDDDGTTTNIDDDGSFDGRADNSDTNDWNGEPDGERNSDSADASTIINARGRLQS